MKRLFLIVLFSLYSCICYGQIHIGQKIEDVYGYNFDKEIKRFEKNDTTAFMIKTEYFYCLNYFEKYNDLCFLSILIPHDDEILCAVIKTLEEYSDYYKVGNKWINANPPHVMYLDYKPQLEKTVIMFQLK